MDSRKPSTAKIKLIANYQTRHKTKLKTEEKMEKRGRKKKRIYINKHFRLVENYVVYSSSVCLTVCSMDGQEHITKTISFIFISPAHTYTHTLYPLVLVCVDSPFKTPVSLKIRNGVFIFARIYLVLTFG